MRDHDLWGYQGKRVCVTYKDGRKTIGVLQRDLSDRSWELLKADADKPKTAPPGIGEILFLQDIQNVEEFKLK